MGPIYRVTGKLLIAGILALVSITAATAGSYSGHIEAWLAKQGYGDGFQVQQVNIFGDGDPSNGIEDNRIDMASKGWNGRSRRAWNMAAGTIYCDGGNRGSAVVIDTSEFGKLRSGMILATSAHVLFDLEKRRKYANCAFHFMGLDHLPGYQADVVLELSSIGNFDPSRARNSKLFGKEDWAFLYVRDNIPGIPVSGSVPIGAFGDLGIARNQGLEFQFISYSKSSDSITISTDCEVRESQLDDLGGGGWPGQLLDNCDSEGGSSGGGLVASLGNRHVLVGIRSGAHWSGELFPPDEYPAGPPDGSSWDVLANTNYSRAIDDELIEAVRVLVSRINANSRI